MSARDRILRRRARFVTMALAGAGLTATGACDRSPVVCLSVEQPTSEPMPCLSEALPPTPDAGAEAEDAGTATGDAGTAEGPPSDAGSDAGPPPRPCLTPPRPERPRVCLSVSPPIKEKK